jgi:hypothetical protein
MKKIIILLAFILPLAVLQSCLSGEVLEGNGPLVNKTKNVTSYTKVISDISADITIMVSPNATSDIEIEAQKNILDLIQTEVKEDELYISFSKDVNVINTEGIKINLTVKDLSTLKILGSGDAVIDGNLITEKLTCSVMGSGSILCKNATIGKLDAMLAGSGSIGFEACTAQKARYAINGSGDIEAFDVIAGDADIAITGSGDVEANVAKSIDATITGSGDIVYKGGATIARSSVTGSGEIRK